MGHNTLVDKYFGAVAEHRLYSSPDRLGFYLNHVFRGIDFEGASVLDIGCRAGLCSFYAACSGAAKVVSLEPEEAGSTAGVTSKYQKLANSLNLDQVTLQGITLQEFDPGGQKFDIIILDDSVNHLDEDACINLHRDPAAEESYTKIFRQIYDMAADGAVLIITDASRYNIFPLFGLKNPMVPTIDWTVHQSPTPWTRLLSNAGFSNPTVRWRSLNRFGPIGERLLGNKVASFFLWSRFCLTMRKKAG